MKTNTERKDRIMKLNDRLNFLSETKEVKAYKTYLLLSDDKKMEIKNKWKKYYKDALESESYKNFVKIREAVKCGDRKTIKECSDSARFRKIANNYPLTPSSIDTELLLKDIYVQDYIRLQDEIKELGKYTSMSAEDIFS